MTASPEVQFNDGAAYEQLMGRWSRKVGIEFLDWCNVAPGLKWLDVGCGNGAFTEEICNRAAPLEVVGVDPSEGQIAFARQRPGCRQAHFQTGTADNLLFEDGYFDAAIMALVISFVTDPLQAVREMRRVVKSEGLVATYMWDLPGGGVPLAPFYRAFKAMGEKVPMPPNPDVSRIEELEKLWRSAGLHNVETKIFHINVHFKTLEDFWHSNTLPVGPQAERVNSLSEDRRLELKQALQASLPIASDGSITYEAFANAVKGWA